MIFTGSGVRRVGAAIVATYLLACSESRNASRPSAGSERPDVFLIVMDTVRLDVQQLWNPALPIGDALSKLAADGVVFDSLRAPSSWTRTSVATLLTGLDPAQHRVLRRRDRLSAVHQTLAALLSEHGYETRGWSTNPNVLPVWGFDHGFDEFFDVRRANFKGLEVAGTEVVDRVLKVIDDDREPGRGFYYIHLVDPHLPYTPAEGELAEVHGLGAVVGESYPGPSSGSASIELRAEGYPKYLAEVMELDRALGKLFEGLRERGRYDDALILAVSDHGEEFFDHGGLAHMVTLYEEVLRVPGVLKLPLGGRAGSRVSKDVEMRDMLPTVAGILGIEPPADLPGHDVFTQVAADLPGFYALQVEPRRLSAVRVGSWKLIVSHRTNRRQLFDLEADPREENDLSRKQPARVAQLLDVLERSHPLHAPGWHILACGCDSQSSVRLSLSGVGIQVVPIGLEEADVLRPTSAGVDVELRLTPERLETRAARRSTLITDRDELVITSAEDIESLEATRPDSPGSPLVGLGNGPLEAFSAGLLFSEVVARARISASEPVLCSSDPPALRGKTAASCEPHLRVWYTAAPEQAARSEVDPVTVERLRALGYTLD